MTRWLRLAALLSLAGLAVACGSTRRAAVPPPAPTPKPRHVAPAPRPRVHHKAGTLVVTVLDGDRRIRVPGARVSIAGQSKHASRTGVVRIRVRHRRPLDVTITAPGFSPRTVLEHFELDKHATIRIYRPDLQWPIYGVTDSRTQAQQHIRLRPPFRTVWSVDLGGLIEYPAVVDDGVAYIGNASAAVQAISMRFGEVLWKHYTPHAIMASSPAVVGGELVYHTMDGHVYVLDRANGRLRWSYSVGAAIESSPVVVDGVDYFGSWNGGLYALDLRTHRLRWSRSLGAKITASVSIAGGRLYVGDYAGRIWAIGRDNGATRWVGTVNGRIYGSSPVADGRVFVPSSDGNSLTAFSTGGRELWRIYAGGYVYSSPAVWQGRVFFGSYDGWFYGVSAASGRILWRVWAGGPISGAAVVVDGVAYAGSFAHRIVGVDATTGRKLLTFDGGQYVPVSGNGMRLLFHAYSRLYAVEPRTLQGRRHHRAVTRTTARHQRHPRRRHR